MSRVLIVEDSSAEIQALQCELTAAGFAVEIVRRPDDAWAALQRQSPDLLLVGLSLEGDAAFPFIRRVKGDTRFAGLTVAGQARQPDPPSVLRALEAGADGFLGLARPEPERLAAVRRIIAHGP